MNNIIFLLFGVVAFIMPSVVVGQPSAVVGFLIRSTARAELEPAAAMLGRTLAKDATVIGYNIPKKTLGSVGLAAWKEGIEIPYGKIHEKLPMESMVAVQQRMLLATSYPPYRPSPEITRLSRKLAELWAPNIDGIQVIKKRLACTNNLLPPTEQRDCTIDTARGWFLVRVTTEGATQYERMQVWYRPSSKLEPTLLHDINMKRDETTMLSQNMMLEKGATHGFIRDRTLRGKVVIKSASIESVKKLLRNDAIFRIDVPKEITQKMNDDEIARLKLRLLDVKINNDGVNGGGEPPKNIGIKFESSKDFQDFIQSSDKANCWAKSEWQICMKKDEVELNGDMCGLSLTASTKGKVGLSISQGKETVGIEFDPETGWNASSKRKAR